MKALILVGGFGTRLRPLTLTAPKPAVEFCNKPMILHQLEALVDAGVTEVILAIAYQPHLMSQQMAKFEKKLNIKITYSQETEPLGTAGPLALAREHLTGTEPFFVLNSDITCTFPFNSFLEFHKKHGKEGSIMVTKVEEPSKYGVVVLDSSGKILKFVEKPKEFVGNKINAGIYLFNPPILDRIELRPTSIEKEVFPNMAEAGELYAMELPNFWMDVGQPKDFIHGTSLFLGHQLSSGSLPHRKGFIQPVLVHETAKIGDSCVIGPNVSIGPNCVIEEGVRLSNTTLLSDVIVKSNSWINSSIIGWQSSVGRWARIENVSVLGQDVHIEDEVHINGGKILPHKSISASVREPAIIM